MNEFANQILREGQTIKRLDSDTDMGCESLFVVWHPYSDSYYTITKKNGEYSEVLKLS